MTMPEPDTSAHAIRLASDAIVSNAPIVAVTADDQMTDEEGAQVARDVTLGAEAIENFEEVLQELQAQINALETTTQAQTNQISRLAAAFGTLPCPKESGVSDLMVDGSVTVESIQSCVKAGICSCEMGYILISETWTPPA